MSKAILVMDMPEHECLDCPFYIADCVFRDTTGCENYHEGFRCFLTGCEGNSNCPLVPAIGYIQPVGHMVSWEDEE